MKQIAYLASKATLPGSPTRRTDAFEHDLMMDALRPAFAALDMSIEAIDWAAPDMDWSRFDAVLIGTTWDYWDYRDEFLATLERIEAQSKLFNGAGLVRWNSHKGYLKDLEAKGARLIPTYWMDRVTPPLAAGAFATFGSDTLVFKRQVGAGADGQHRVRRGEPLPDMPHPMMVQPFLAKIVEEGEISFIFVDGDFSHALIKRAAKGDYRIQSIYGGTEEAISPSAADLQAAQAILDMLDAPPLYARVDMLRGDDGGLLLMEMELIEPYLYPIEGPELGARLAAAVQKRLG